MLDPVKKKTRAGERRSQPEEDGLLRQRADRETVCSGNGRIERRSAQTVNRSRRLSTVKDRGSADDSWTDEVRRSAETAEDSNQHTGKILGAVGAEKERREWSCSRVGGSYCYYLSFLLSADCFFVD